MEKITYLLAGAIAILIVLILWLWRTNRKLKRMEGEFAKLQYETRKAQQEAVLVKGKLNQIENAQFDFSELEDRIEENAGQLVSFVRQEIGQTINDMQDLDDRIGDLEIAAEKESQVLGGIEEKIDERLEEDRKLAKE